MGTDFISAVMVSVLKKCNAPDKLCACTHGIMQHMARKVG
jgi:hypothetical protein